MLNQAQSSKPNLALSTVCTELNDIDSYTIDNKKLKPRQKEKSTKASFKNAKTGKLLVNCYEVIGSIDVACKVIPPKDFLD